MVKEEKVVRNFAFASESYYNKYKKGENFRKKNIWVKRPGGDFLARDFSKILNKKSKKIHSIKYTTKKTDVL